MASPPTIVHQANKYPHTLAAEFLTGLYRAHYQCTTCGYGDKTLTRCTSRSGKDPSAHHAAAARTACDMRRVLAHPRHRTKRCNFNT